MPGPHDPTSTAEPIERFPAALQFAATIHAAQRRKGSDTPYVAHLLAVASLVMENGGSEDQAIAALLHHTIEDQAAAFGGAGTLREEIRQRFGDGVLGIVEACTDADVSPKPPWKKRKNAYIEHLASAPEEALLVSAADKLHNARSIVADLKQYGPNVWSRFKGGREDTLGYFRALVAAFSLRAKGWIYEELRRVIHEMRALADAQSITPAAELQTHTKDKNGHVRHWWAALPAVPPSRDDDRYRRLQRVWWDTSRFHWPRGRPDPLNADDRKYHEFVKLRDETHLTVSLWENFCLFPASEWVPPLLASAALNEISTVRNCSWSYEWCSWWKNDSGDRKERMCDVVVEISDAASRRHLLIVESKRLRTTISGDDLDLTYYLNVPEIRDYPGSKSLLYLIDEAVREKVLTSLGPLPPNIGVTTWQQLGGLQIALAQALPIEVAMRRFIAGSIQFQFAQHDIRPVKLVFDYLEGEPSIADLEAGAIAQQPIADQYVRMWQLP